MEGARPRGCWRGLDASGTLGVLQEGIWHPAVSPGGLQVVGCADLVAPWPCQTSVASQGLKAQRWRAWMGSTELSDGEL